MKVTSRRIGTGAIAIAAAGLVLAGCNEAKDAANSATDAGKNAPSAASNLSTAAKDKAGEMSNKASKAWNDQSKPAVASTDLMTPEGKKVSINDEAILKEYAKYGYADGHLGKPLGPVVTIKGGKFLTLQGGSIYWSEASGAHVVHGKIGDYWGKLNHENGKLGYPTSDEESKDGKITQKFQHGELTFDPATGKVTESR